VVFDSEIILRSFSTTLLRILIRLSVQLRNIFLYLTFFLVFYILIGD
jgi:hypothetical protein